MERYKVLYQNDPADLYHQSALKMRKIQDHLTINYYLGCSGSVLNPGIWQ